MAAVRYPAANIPSDEELVRDLAEAMTAYDALIREGTWIADDDILSDVADENPAVTLAEAKRYRQHRRIERASGTSKRVKDTLGTTCMACDVVMGEVYGEVAAGYIEAHHLKPLSSYADGASFTLDPRRDFAVLCPNCHRVIHRMEDTSDLAGLRALVRRNT